MSLIHQWDVRQGSYTNGADITSITDQVGGLNLVQVATENLPSYDATFDAAFFDGSNTEIIGAGSASLLTAALQAATISIFVLRYKPTAIASGPRFFSIGYNSNSNAVLALQDITPSSLRTLTRDSTATGNEFTDGSLTADQWEVAYEILDATDVILGLNSAANNTSQAISATPANFNNNQVSLGAMWRSGTNYSDHWTGYIQEVRIYDSDESANIDDIIASMISGSGLFISDVDGDDIIDEAQQNVAINGNEFGSTQGTGGVTIDGIVQTIDTWGDTQILFDHVADLNKHGLQTLEVTTDGAETVQIPITINPPAGKKFADITNVDNSAIESTPALSPGKQVRYDSVTSPGGYDATIDSNGQISVDAADPDGDTITIEFWDPGTEDWGSGAVQTLDLSTAPVITGNASPALQEEQTVVVGTYTITNRNTELPTLTGVDAALFDINFVSGDDFQLVFLSAPNFESPLDVGGNNVYNLAINIDNLVDPANTFAVAVTVTNLVEPSYIFSTAGLRLGFGF